MKLFAWLFLALPALTICEAAPSTVPAESLRIIRAVGPEGQGNAAASSAWKELVSQDARHLPQILARLGLSSISEFSETFAVHRISIREAFESITA